MLTDLLDLPTLRVKTPAGFTVYFDRAGQPSLHAHLRVAALLDPEDEDLPDGLDRDAAGTLRFTCRSCGHRNSEWFGTPEEFEEDSHYHLCGGSELCLP